MPRRSLLSKVLRALRNTPPSYINLVEWLEDHGHAGTTGSAQRIILDERVMSESHPVGLKTDDLGRTFVSPLVPASLRTSLYVKEPK